MIAEFIFIIASYCYSL